MPKELRHKSEWHAKKESTGEVIEIEIMGDSEDLDSKDLDQEKFQGGNYHTHRVPNETPTGSQSMVQHMSARLPPGI